METGALQSARAVLPMIFDLLAPRSVVDIGCGRGAWLRVAMDPGMPLAEVFDGAYVDRGGLLIPQDRFLDADLSRPFQTPRCYGLALCLEVAEHLPYKAVRSLISGLTAAAPAVLFSAAIPGQPGTRHINPQFPEYWQKLFAEHGFLALDALRPRIYSDARVEPWCAQEYAALCGGAVLRANASPAWVSADRRSRPIIAVGVRRNLAGEIAMPGR